MHDIDEVAAATAGDEAAFTALVERHRHELQVHCYRMLGSFEESEDLLQETFLRAWRRRETYAGRSSFRAWLYRIATNACLDALARRPRTPTGGEVPWLQPYPEELLDALPAPEDGPDAAVVDKETIELAFIVAIQHLSPQARVVLIVRDVLGWSAKETAALLDTSVASINSALQRARATMREHLPEQRSDWPGAEADERALVARYVEATERGDAFAIAELLTEDARFSMPPEPGLWRGRDAILAFWRETGFGTGEYADIRCLTTRANHQPAVACYVRRPGTDRHVALAVDVLCLQQGRVAEMVTFDPERFPSLGLPRELT